MHYNPPYLLIPEPYFMSTVSCRLYIIFELLLLDVLMPRNKYKVHIKYYYHAIMISKKTSLNVVFIYLIPIRNLMEILWLSLFEFINTMCVAETINIYSFLFIYLVLVPVTYIYQATDGGCMMRILYIIFYFNNTFYL